MTYHLKDSHHSETVIKRIEKHEYELIKKFNESFNLYEGVFFAYSNYHNAKKDYVGFKNSLETINAGAFLDEIQRKAIYPITAVVVFLNTFLDNTKNFNSAIKSKKIETEIKKLNGIESIRILRAVRNYSIHASIPVKGTTRQINLMDNTEKYEFYIEKDIIIRNRPNSNDLKNLQKLKSNKIKLNYMIEEAADELEKLWIITFEEFIEYIPKEIKDILFKYVRFYKTKEGVQYFANVFIKSKIIGKSRKGTGFITEESVYFDSTILEAVVSQIYADIS